MSKNSALSGIRVLDLSRVLAGPWATQNLADMGADVIKIEKPEAGDDTRKWGPPFVKNSDTAAYFTATNRGKRSVTVDISVKDGQKIILDLAAKSDIFIENFKVGKLAEYSLSYDDIKAVNPKIIYCSISGFGQTGPYADKAGYDYMIQAMGGLMSVTGEVNQPMRVGVPIADLMTGMYATIAILGALNARYNTGQGQYIDLALFDVQLAMLANQASNYLVSGEVPQLIGNTHPNIVPYQLFKSKIEPFIIAVGNDNQFAALCYAIGLGDLISNELYKTNDVRVENRESLIPIIQEKLKTESSDYWIKLLEENNVPCQKLNNIEQALSHPQAKARNMVIEAKYGDADIAMVKSPISSVDSDVIAPSLGQHTVEVLSQILNLSDVEIENLKKNKIIT